MHAPALAVLLLVGSSASGSPELVPIVELRDGWPKVAGEGEIDLIKLRRSVEARRGELKRCYERRMLQVGPSLAGSVVFEWTIEPDGRASQPKALRATLVDDEVTACLQPPSPPRPSTRATGGRSSWDLARKTGAGRVILGTVVCEDGGAIQGTAMHSFRATAALEVVDVRTRKLLTSAVLASAVGHTDARAGGQRAFVSLAEKVGAAWRPVAP